MNSKKLNAESGVNSAGNACLKLCGADVAGEHRKRAYNRFFAVKPDISPVTARQSPNPAGTNSGAQYPSRVLSKAVGGILYHIETRVKRLKEPNDYGAKEYNRKRAMDKSCFVPKQQPHAPKRGQPVIWQLHYKRHRLTAKYGVLQHACRRYAQNYAVMPQSYHYNGGVA